MTTETDTIIDSASIIEEFKYIAAQMRGDDTFEWDGMDRDLIASKLDSLCAIVESTIRRLKTRDELSQALIRDNTAIKQQMVAVEADIDSERSRFRLYAEMNRIQSEQLIRFLDGDPDGVTEYD